MRKIEKSPDLPATLVNAPIPESVADVREQLYKSEDVRRQLVKDQHNKCAYCECYLPLQYHDVEHFRPKSHYYWLGHDWKNLLYSCERCNRSYKKANFPLAAGSIQANSPTDNIAQEYPLLINPTEVDPIMHIKFDKFMAKGITPQGEKTIEMFHLNDSIECPELIDNRKQLYELYEIEIGKIRIAEKLLESPNLSIEEKNLANELISLSEMSIRELQSTEKPFSGMLIAQNRSYANN